MRRLPRLAPRQQRVHRRHHEDGEQRAHRHAPHDHPADLLAALSPRARGQRQRDRPQHHRPRGHQDGPQPQARRPLHRVKLLQPLLTQLVGELHDQDAVLGDQPHERDQPDLTEHVERAPRQLERQQRAHHRQRHRQQDDERIDKALELRRQHQENEQQRQHEHQRQRSGGIAEFAALAIEVGGVPHGQDLTRRALHEIQRLAQ